MASLVITLPHRQAIIIVVPNGDQVVPITLAECECGCEKWFQPVEPHQIYFNAEHQQARNNQKRRKTERRRKA